ncbi:MAG TPA: APC family permease [Actinomycetota bacterium]|nr:APC family permease [Actinomycetota bacterium]
MAAAPEAPTLFLRKATGLVKGWNAFDAFIYAFLSVNLVTLGLYIISFAPFIPDAQVLPAVIVTGILVTFLVITYAGLISTMPRAGGDYVWQSRVLSGGVAFVLAVTGWWFILWHWAPIYGNILSYQFFQPLFTIFGAPDTAAWFGTNNGIFVTSLIVIVLAAGVVSLGMEGYARFQKFCWWGAMVGLAVMFLLMLFNGRADFQAAFNRAAPEMFGISGDAYAATIKASEEAGYRPALSLTPFLGPSLLLIPMVAFYLLWPNWGATLYGEVRGAGDFKRVFNGMFWGLWVTVILSVLFFLLADRTFGWDFYMAANNNFWTVVYGGESAAAMPIWPYPALLAGLLVDNAAFQAILILLMSLWFFGWMGTLFLSSTRVIFAAAFDRILPEWAASVSERRHVPVGALMLMLIPSVVVSALYAYNATFRTATLDATLVIAVTFLGTAFAATILPWRRPRIFENSPIARYRVAGVPLISIGGAVTFLFLAWLLYLWLRDDVYGVNNPTSLRYMGILYALALVIYVVAKVVRSRQGIDLKRIHQEIPVE